MIAELARLTGPSCEYILTYCHEKNESVERINRDLLQWLRAMGAEMKLDMTKWSDSISSVMGILIQNPRQPVAGRTAIECFAVLKPDALLNRIFMIYDMAVPIAV